MTHYFTEVTNQQKKEKEAYDEILDKNQMLPYGRLVFLNPLDKFRIAHLNDLVKNTSKLDKESLLLDVGCSDGYFLFTLPKQCTKIGIDFVPAVVASGNKAKNRLNRLDINFVIGDCGFLSFKQKIANTVICAEILEHLPSTNHVLKEAYNALTEKGHLIITVPFIDFFSSIQISHPQDNKKFSSPRHHREYAFTQIHGTVPFWVLLRNLTNLGFYIDNVTFIGILHPFPRIYQFVLNSSSLSNFFLIFERTFSKLMRKTGMALFGRYLLIHAIKN
jgi:2-polyprenyl-3-methyl-5-hydroxy-6-metoxy-1,4-benzoquinol methylase